jgi:FdhD protein
MDSIDKLPIQCVNKEGRQETEDAVIKESPLTIFLNGRELVTLLCSPTCIDYLVVGFLFSEGLIQNNKDIKKISVDNQMGTAYIDLKENDLTSASSLKRLLTSDSGHGINYYRTASTQEHEKVESLTTITDCEVFALSEALQNYSVTYKATGGAHSAALCDTRNILVFNEDIGRHNAIDKVFGECIIKDIPTHDRILIISGRIPSEILFKVIRSNIPILISKAAPTDLGVKLANELGITLIGFAREQRMNVYSNGWRVISNGRYES